MFVRLARRSAASLSGGRSIGPACSSASARIATVPPLTTNVSVEPPRSTSTNAAPNAVKAAGWRRAPRARRRRFRGRRPRALPEVGSEQEHHQENPADDRHREQQLQRAFGDELHGDERPVRGGEERTAFERGFQRRGLRHRQVDCTSCVFCWFSVLSCFRAVSRSNGDVAPPARGRAHRGRAGDPRGRGVRGLALRRVSRRSVRSRSDESAAISIASRPALAGRRRRRRRSRRGSGAGRRPGRRARSVRPRRSPHCLRPRRHRRYRGDRLRHAGDRARLGRPPSDIRALDRLSGPAAFFVTPSPLGLRLVHLVPILDAQKHRARLGRRRARALSRVRGGHDHRRIRAADPARARVAAHALGRGGSRGPRQRVRAPCTWR